MAEFSDTVVDAARATGELAKSVGRFSLALSVLAAREMASLIASATDGSATGPSMQDVTRAAGSQLSGAMLTAYSIGVNVQSGLVDAAFDLAGLGARGQAPSGDTSGADAAMMERIERRVTALRTMAAGELNRPVPQLEFVERLSHYQVEASGSPIDRVKAMTGLWKSEGLSTSVGTHLLLENTLRDPALLINTLPIAHVGFGIGSAEALRFDSAGINARIDATCHSDYRYFAYEGIGAALRLYEPGLFKVMTGALGVIPLDAPEGPDPEGFFASYLGRYPLEIQRLITHGYGRFVALSNLEISAAISQVTTLPPPRIEPAAQGCGFAFALMNSAALPHVLDHSAIGFEKGVRAAFQSGVVYGLVFFDWYAPGLLSAWEPTGVLETELVEHARREAEMSRLRGYLLPFRLENPRT